MRKQNVWALCLIGIACLVSCDNEQEFSGMTSDLLVDIILI